MRKKMIVGCLAVLVLSGCSTQVAGQPSAVSTSTAADGSVQTVPMPNLGPLAAAATVSATAEESACLAEQDQCWQQVVAIYPDGTRPPDPFTAYTPLADQQAALQACMSPN